jgi:hypothetical protein
MSDRRPEVADVFRTYEKEFFASGGMFSVPNSERPSKRFATAARLPSAAMYY